MLLFSTLRSFYLKHSVTIYRHTQCAILCKAKKARWTQSNISPSSYCLLEVIPGVHTEHKKLPTPERSLLFQPKHSDAFYPQRQYLTVTFVGILRRSRRNRIRGILINRNLRYYVRSLVPFATDISQIYSYFSSIQGVAVNTGRSVDR